MKNKWLLLCNHQASVEQQNPHKFSSLMRFPLYPLALRTLPNLQGSQWFHQLTAVSGILATQNRRSNKTCSEKHSQRTFHDSWYILFFQYTAGCLMRCAGCSRNHHRRCTCSCHGRSPRHTSTARLKKSTNAIAFLHNLTRLSKQIEQNDWVVGAMDFQAEITIVRAWTESNGNTVRKHFTK